MKILSWNIRGLGKKEKRSKIKKMVRDRGVDILFLQETKLKSTNSFFINSIWGHSDFGFMEVDSNESSGGLLCVWNSNLFKLMEVCSNRNFLLLSGICGSDFSCILINVYGPCIATERGKLWDTISSLRVHYPAPWCLGGDLNEIRNTEERQGCSVRDRGMRDFNNFIDDMEFMDLQLLGRSFTWSNSQVNEKWSRIDRFLLHSEWLDRFNLKQWGLARTLSDHCPILLMEDERDWGPKPFRFFNAWLENKECLIIMENAWRVNHKHRWAAVRICMKLKGMKEALKI